MSISTHLSGKPHQLQYYLMSLSKETMSPATALKFNGENFDKIISFSDNTGLTLHANYVHFENLSSFVFSSENLLSIFRLFWNNNMLTTFMRLW